jgi:hypothetical protein
LIRIDDAMASEHGAAMAALQNLESWTSHTVVVVDQSGSMRETDVEGHATRAEAVWLTLAFSCVGDQIRSGERTGADAMSIISMRTTSALLVDREPVDWLLYNKIVGFLRNERPSEHGMYNDAIQLAETCLLKHVRGNCALALLILSDGKPSDTNTEFHGRIDDLASKFGRRLAVGTIGFAGPSEDFKTLKRMTKQCASYDCQASFHAPALTAHSLKQVLTSLSATVTRTKVEMTAVGGSLQRTVRNVQRESKLAVANEVEADDDVCHRANEWLLFDSSTDEIRRATWDSDKETATEGADPWTKHDSTFLHESARGVAMHNKIFGEGAERMVKRFREIDEDLNYVGPWMVAKESRYVEEISQKLQFHEVFCKTQQAANRIAQEFNARLSTIPGVSSTTPRIRFLDCHVYYLGDKVFGAVGVLVEKMLNVNGYKKWNTNNGGVDGMPLLLDEVNELAPIAEDEAAEDDEDDLAELRSAATCRPTASGVADAAISYTNADIPQAFSCFSYRYSKSKCLVCDLQGVLDLDSSTPCFELTDPVIHYRSSSGREGVFGRTDRGPKGMSSFFKTHKCTDLCRALMKEWLYSKAERSEMPQEPAKKRNIT